MKKKILALSMMFMFAVALAAPVSNAMVQKKDPQKKECTKKCTKDKKECTKAEKKACSKTAEGKKCCSKKK